MQNEKEGWNADELSDEASQKDEDEIHRQMKRGDETKGDPNERDDAGTVDTDQTPRGREETKNKIKEQSKENG